VSDSTVVVVGSGPGGCAAAIVCAAAGLRVVLLEREAFPRDRPGETLHPGVEPLLERLGVGAWLAAAPLLRHEGHWVQWGGERRFDRFGADERGPWLGFQAWRADFDALLLRRAVEAGASVLQPCQAVRPLLAGGRVVGVETAQGAVPAAFVVDAAGGRHWLARRLGLALSSYSPPLAVRFGYVEGHCPAVALPLLAADDEGWTWQAEVRPGLYAWTRLPFTARPLDRAWLPLDLRGLRPRGESRGADVTWRLVPVAAGPGYFLIGDAAAVLDPASSHGVLKALMSGMMAAHLICNVSARKLDPTDAARHYTRWLRGWFEHDVRKLNELYSAVGRPFV
jgi:flavin-dependent dehydrogenase